MHEKIEDLGTSIRSEIRAKDDLIQLQLQKILDQTTKTNGRVNRLEEETKIWRILQENPKLALISAALFIALIVKGIGIGWEKIVKLIT
jgi:hypothetical protein